MEGISGLGSRPSDLTVHVDAVALPLQELGGFEHLIRVRAAKLHRKRCGCGGKKKEEDEDPKVDLRRA